MEPDEDAQQTLEEERARRIGIQQLLQANGITEEDVQNPDGVTQIEMVLDDYCNMIALKYFQNLRSVVLIQQAISAIEGLECCPLLERLLLNENRIRVIEGLQKCSKLRVLQLCTNLIEEIGNSLQDLNQLEVFWIAENQLTNLDGINRAPNLKEINASRNRLTTIVHAFAQNASLTSINVSDNRICSFRDILDLSRLPGLHELCFSDPDWGDNPICSLCNYQTYTLFHLPTLRMHDRMRISEDEHQSAQAAFSKKRLYYNMRIKTIKRIAADGTRWAKSLDDERLNMQTAEFEVVARKLKRIEAFSRVKEENAVSGQSQETDPAMNQDRSSVERQLLEWQGELADASTLLNSLQETVEVEMENLIQGLELELQTGGNIRLEPGTAERDPWFAGVEELIKARFHAQDLSRFGISDIKVHKVTCVHNRSLRIRLDDMMDRADSEAPQKLDYLFYVPEPSQTQADLRAAIEQGPGYDRKKDALGPVVLTNSVTIIEAPRIEGACATPVGQAVARAAQRAAKRSDTPMTLPAPVVCGGTVLVCSAHLSDAQAHTTPKFEFSASSTAGARTLWPQEAFSSNAFASNASLASPKYVSENATFSSEAPDITPDTSKPSALYKARADDPKQQVWLVPEPEVVLPEFLVEFDYVYSSGVIRSQVVERLEEHGPLAAVFRDFALHSKLGAPEAQEEEAETPTSRSEMPELQQIERVENSTMPLVRKLLCADPDPLVFNSLVVVNLHGRGIRRLDPTMFQEMALLRVLLLSFNSLESVSSLPRLAGIAHVDISFNIIEKIDSLGGLPGLRELDLSWNSLLFQDSLITLSRDVPQLESLHLVGNPMAKGTSGPRCRARALARLKCLRQFDGKDVPANEMLQAQQSDVQANELTEGMLVEHAYTSLACQTRRASRRSATPLSIGWDASRNRIAELMGRNGDSHSVINRSNWKEFVECLDLRRLELTDLCVLKGFPQLGRLLLANNELTSLARFSQCTSLEELSLEGNSLRSLQGASTLLNLQRLDAGSNQIEEVLDLQKLGKLCQLSLEDNFLDSLDTFSMLHGLTELYLSNNLIEELRAVLMLKPLPKLVILDLSGNGLCSAKDYRFYTIFHLRRLKVLDGRKVTASEQQEAEDRFSGRLTMELLEDKLGPVPACYNLRSVDLSGLNLKDLGNLLNDDMFPSLRELNIEGNPFSDMRTVGPLSKLAVLRMNKSKIDPEKMIVEDEQIGGLAALPHLQVLEMGESGISDMSAFEKFPLQQLRILHLPGNEITKLEGLSNLEQLRELVIDHNKIKQFEENSFQGLRCLRELRAEDNGLKSLANLGPLPRLRALYLSQNRVAELPELEKLSSLRHVMLVHLQQNPVARKPLYRSHVIQALPSVRVIDGREVSEEEREKSEQLLQSSDPSKAMGLYAFSDQQTTNVGGIYVTTAPEAAVKPVTNSMGIADALRSGNANGPSNIRMTGQIIEGTEDRRGETGGMISGSGMLVARRAVAAVTAANAFRRGGADKGSHGDVGSVEGTGNSDGSKKPHTSRSSAAPRQASSDPRPPTIPQPPRQ